MFKVLRMKRVGDFVYGVLDTPMFPARYYSGVIRCYSGEWLPTDNATCYWRELQEALDDFARR